MLIDRRVKVQSGQRITSFTWLLNDKRGAIGRTLAKIPAEHREVSFMGGQFGEQPASRQFKHCPVSHILFLSLLDSHGTTRGVPLVRQCILEFCVYPVPLRRLCVERWRFLY